MNSIKTFLAWALIPTAVMFSEASYATTPQPNIPFCEKGTQLLVRCGEDTKSGDAQLLVEFIKNLVICQADDSEEYSMVIGNNDGTSYPETIERVNGPLAGGTLFRVLKRDLKT